MIILACNDHHYLPFWTSKGDGRNDRFTSFDPKEIDLWHFPSRGEDKEPVSLSESWMYPILQGISQLDAFDDMVAYVSLILDPEKKLCDFSKRCWVQFSNLPQFTDGIPQVFSEDGNLLVKNLWIADNKTKGPHQLPEGYSNDDPLLDSADFWKQWFLKSLLDHRDREINDAMATIAAANRTIDLFRSMCG